MECMTICRGYFRGFTAAEKTGTLGSLAACARPWDSNPSRKNEIECCVDRLIPPHKADIPEPAVNVRYWGKSGHRRVRDLLPLRRLTTPRTSQALLERYPVSRHHQSRDSRRARVP